MSNDARFRSGSARNRALAIFALVSGGLGAVILMVALSSQDSARGVVLEVETATLSALPAPPSTAPSDPDDVDPDNVIVPENVPAAPSPPPLEKVPPTGITINDLSVSQGVLAVGLEEDGAMEVPDVEDIGWYRHGAVPGRPGATVFVAHVWWGDSPGPFSQLGQLEPGAQIEVEVDDTVHNYVVTERTMYDKDSLPGSLWRNTGPETLVLITCGGTFDYTTRSYEQNIVVLAVPANEVSDSALAS